jgi:dinuclear metal center YbgI/SA1388 family protein
MIKTLEIVNFCDEVTKKNTISDFSGSFNGLQVDNSGIVSKIGASVDAGLVPFQKAVGKNITFLISHHGLFWSSPIPIVGAAFNKIKLCIDNDLAIYGSHLPLDCHPEIGNNAIIANKLGLEPVRGFLPVDSTNIGLIARNHLSRSKLKNKLDNLFPAGFHSIEYGIEKPSKIAILSGSGQSAVEKLIDEGVDTLITGELKQQHFNYAQENKLNLYICGHYATETFGVDKLAQQVAKNFNLPYEFIEIPCPL